MNFQLQENVSLSNYTSFRVGGFAKYFAKCRNEQEIVAAIKWANEKNIPIFVLADGTNVIASEKGFNGLALKASINYVNREENTLEAGSAASMEELVNTSVGDGFSAIEWAGGLPGSFGGAIRGNAGAFGGEMKDSISEVTSISLKTGEQIVRSNAECQFEYRGSIFKKHPEEVIVSAKLSLKKGDRDKLQEIADNHIKYRREKHPLELPNSGSIFKNIPVEKVPPDELDKWQDFVKTDPFPVVPAAKIIADVDLPGVKIGGAELSKKHSNYIVNAGDATGEDIFELINKIKFTVFEKYQIELEVEPELLGF